MENERISEIARRLAAILSRIVTTMEIAEMIRKYKSSGFMRHFPQNGYSSF